MAKQGREVPPEWEWTEASVWTERRLETLERGSKGGKWFSLTDKVWKRENLHSAMKTVVQNKGAAGVDGQKAEQYLLETAHHRPRLGGGRRPQRLLRPYPAG
jgi:RNA-directed DNA polymerase